MNGRPWRLSSTRGAGTRGTEPGNSKALFSLGLRVPKGCHPAARGLSRGPPAPSGRGKPKEWTMDIAFVIPAYNEEALIGKCVEFGAGRDQALRAADADVVVVNNNSTDRTAEVAAAYAGRARRRRAAEGPGQRPRRRFSRHHGRARRQYRRRHHRAAGLARHRLRRVREGPQAGLPLAAPTSITICRLAIASSSTCSTASPS